MMRHHVDFETSDSVPDEKFGRRHMVRLPDEHARITCNHSRRQVRWNVYNGVYQCLHCGEIMYQTVEDEDMEAEAAS